MVTYRCDDELYHFGIKGMKWGVRRERKSANKRRQFSPETRNRLRRLAGATLHGIGTYNAFKGLYQMHDEDGLSRRFRNGLIRGIAGTNAMMIGNSLYTSGGGKPAISRLLKPTRKSYSDAEIKAYRKAMIKAAPTGKANRYGKGWYRNAPKTTLIREMRNQGL